MTQQQAINLINKAIPQSNEPQQWADLGCGDGTFTNAIANLLPDGSHIFGVDKANQNLPKIMGNRVSVDFIKGSFENFDFNFSNLNGILMANSLHYVDDKKSLILHLEKYLSQDKRFLIVEYDTSIANQWVPYPISFLNLKNLFMQFENYKIDKIAERQSIYGQGNLYSALISFDKPIQ